MMMSSIGNFFCVTGPLCREFTSHWWIPLTKASDMELWCFLWSVPKQMVVNSREACDLRRHRGHYDITVMSLLGDMREFIVVILQKIDCVIIELNCIMQQPGQGVCLCTILEMHKFIAYCTYWYCEVTCLSLITNIWSMCTDYYMISKIWINLL